MEKLKKYLVEYNVLIILMVFFLIGAVSGCKSTGYEFGDITKKASNTATSYCQSENEEARLFFKAVLNSQGVKVGVDYCAVRGFVGGVLSSE